MVFAIIAIGFGMEKGRRLTAQTDYEMTHVNESMYEFFIDCNSMHKNKKILLKNQKSARGDWRQSDVTVLSNCLLKFLITKCTLYILKNSLKKYTKQNKVIATKTVQSETQ